MNSIRLRVTMGVSTCAALLICLTGCPPKPAVQTAQVNNTAPPHVITKRDLDTLYFEYAKKLDPKGGGGVGKEPAKELTLVNFVDDPDRAHRHLDDLKRDVEKILRERGARIVAAEPVGPWEYVIRYDHKNIHGTAKIRFVPHHQNPNHWTMELKIEERPF